MNLAGKQKLPIPCPQCGTKSMKTLDWLQKKGKVSCPRCGTKVKLTKKDIRKTKRVLDRLDDILSHLGN